mgnify:CR=1 FL=1
MSEETKYTLVIPAEFERILKSIRKRKPELYNRLYERIPVLLREPQLGKPLRNVLRNYRRIHIGSFVLLYEIKGSEVRLLDFDHHDRIYKKYR